MLSEIILRRVWLLVLAFATAAVFPCTSFAEPVISEFMAANVNVLADNDGEYADWIEIHNSGGAPIPLEGWYLTDSPNNKAKWRFPAVTLPAGGYLLVFASNKDRRDPSAPLHTNFALSAGGEYLALIRPDGATVAQEYAPQFPAQRDDVSYGLVEVGGNPVASYLMTPTPGAPNAGGGAVSSAKGSDEVKFSRPGGLFRAPFQLELSTDIGGQQIRFVAASGPGAGVTPLSATSSVYTGPITIHASTTIRAAVFTPDGVAHGPISTISFAKIGTSISGFSSQLPVLVIDSFGSGPLVKDNIDHPTWLYLYASRNDGMPTFAGAPEVASPLTTSVRGSSSALFPKKGYNVKFTDETGDKRAQALLDLSPHEKWALVAPWAFDLSYVNNAFVYSLSNLLGRWAPKTRLVEVFFNSDGNDLELADYAGIYAITDRIEVGPERVDIAPLGKKDTAPDSISGGYLLKIDSPDADEVSWRSHRGMPDEAESSIVLVSPKADDVAPEQLSYIQNYIQRMEDALYTDRAKGWVQRTYLDYIDRASWVDFHLLNTFVANPDAFVRSTYFHKDRGGKMQAGPVWDFDRAIGSHWDTRSRRHDVWFGVGAPDYWKTGWWGLLAEDPEFMQDWVDRWQTLRRNEMSGKNLRDLFNSWVDQVGGAAALRDSTRWPEYVSPHGPYASTTQLTGDWLVQRAEWIDSQQVAPPSVVASGGSLIFTAPAATQLLYTLDGSDPRSLGGEIAPNAIVATGSVTVPASSNVHVRCYRPDLRDVFPGTPWSSAVGGESSSPLSPKARLVNLSSRAMVGAGENALIAGLVVADTETKRYLSRAVGPGLAAFGASGFVPDPQLSIFADNGTELLRNHGWYNGPDASRLATYSRNVGAFPLAAGSSDSALATDVAAGGYTLQVTTPSGRDGIGLAELYELDNNGRTVNLSTRAYVRTDAGVLIGGFVVSGPAHKRLLIRAVGPTLGGFGLTNALKDPVLTIYSGSTIVRVNDRWDAGPDATMVSTASKRAGAFDLAGGSEDAATLITLRPGAYTVEVKGKAGGEGVALLEIYELP